MSTVHKGSPSGPRALTKVTVALADTACLTIAATEVTVVVLGVKATDVVQVNASALTTNLAISVGVVSDDEVKVRFTNPTVGTIQTGAIDLHFSVNSYS